MSTLMTLFLYAASFAAGFAIGFILVMAILFALYAIAWGRCGQ